MTKVRYYSAPPALPGGGAGRAYRLVVAGHAGYGEKGRDIVCAAESMLVQALAGTLAGLSPALLYDYTVEGVAGSGCVGITALPTAAGAERVRGIVESAVTGFCLLAQAYPDYVSIRGIEGEEEENDHVQAAG